MKSWRLLIALLCPVALFACGSEDNSSSTVGGGEPDASGGSGGSSGTTGNAGVGGGTGGQAGKDSGVGGQAGSGGVDSQCPGRLDPVGIAGTVHTVGDGTSVSCTEKALREALDACRTAGSGNIVFNCGGKQTITLASSLQVGSSKDGLVVIDGNGEITISGGGKTRVLDLDNYTNLVVQRLTISDGFVADGEAKVTNKPENSGAAIRHPWYGSLKAINVRFENNHCDSLEGEIGGGAIFAGGLTEAVISGCEFVNNSASNGGGVLNRGTTLTIVDSTFDGNAARSTGDGQFGNGGGLYIDGMNYDNKGGVLHLCGSVFRNNKAKNLGSGVFSFFYEGSSSVIQSCVFDANSFDNGGSGAGALYHEAVPLTLSGTTFSNSTGGQHAGGLFLASNSSAQVTNCTFANNQVSGNGAGIFDGASELHLTNCTFSGNSADYGPAIFKGQSATVSLKNTIFANNATANQYSALSCHEAMTDEGGNMQWPQTKPNGKADVGCTAAIKFADPLLQPLADNEGFSQTFALGAGSPAIKFATGCPATDQRGKARTDPCDSGAFETQP